MVRIAITGHRGLPADTVRLVDDAVRSALAEHDAERLTGISCLADGADQIFARAVVDLGGALEVVVPARRYREGLPAESHPEYDDLMRHAVRVHRLDFVESTPESSPRTPALQREPENYFMDSPELKCTDMDAQFCTLLPPFLHARSSALNSISMMRSVSFGGFDAPRESADDRFGDVIFI